VAAAISPIEEFAGEPGLAASVLSGAFNVDSSHGR